MKKSILLAGLSLLSLSAIFYSCKKQAEDTETQTAVDNNLCEEQFDVVLPLVNSIAINEKGVKKTNGSCPMVSIDTTNLPIVMTLDYDTGCVDTLDGKTKRGKIICEFDGKWSKIGTKVKVTLKDYYVNDVHYEGTITLERLTLFSYRKTVSGGKCSQDSWTVSWQCDRTFTWNEGAQTATKVDDEFEVKGQASGVNRKGKGFNVVIQSPLIRRGDCKWIQKGIMQIAPDGLDPRTIDFGDGTCDNQAKMIIHGNSFTIDL